MNNTQTAGARRRGCGRWYQASRKTRTQNAKQNWAGHCSLLVVCWWYSVLFFSRCEWSQSWACQHRRRRLHRGLLSGRHAGGPRCGRQPQRLTQPHPHNTSLQTQNPPLRTSTTIPPLINPTYKGLQDWALQKEKWHFCCQNSKSCLFFLFCHLPRNICKLRSHC